MLSMVPKALAVTGQGLPDVCARHGKPATVRYRFDVSTPIGPEILLLFFGVIPFVVYRYATRETATVGPWPFCADCLSRRKNIAIFGTAAGILSIAGAVASVAVSSEPGLFFLGILLLAIVTAVTLKYLSWADLAKATYTENQQFVQVYAAREFALAAKSAPAVVVAAPPQPPRVPIPWFRPLNSVWVIALVLGILGVVGPVFTRGEVTTKTYVLLAAGAVLTIVGGAGTAANKIGNRRRYAAFVAAQNG